MSESWKSDTSDDDEEKGIEISDVERNIASPVSSSEETRPASTTRPQSTTRPISTARPVSIVRTTSDAWYAPVRPVSVRPVSAANRPLSMSVGSRPVSLARSVAGTRPGSVMLSPRESVRVSARYQHIEVQLEHPISMHIPVFALAMVIAICVSYCLGVYFSGDLSFSSVSMQEPVSPNNRDWWFFTVSPFPSCEDLRPQAWRLVSAQLVHSGLMHLGGNALCILIFGSALEMYHPLSLLAAVTIFELSHVAGVLGFAVLFPYVGLVGASPGGYGLIGACWYAAVANRDLLHPSIAFILPGMLLVELAMDLSFYFLFYDPTVAYSSHLVGMVTGFLIAMAMTSSYRKWSWWSVLLSVVGTVGFSIIVGYLVWHYLIFFPPRPILSSSFDNLDQASSCCSQLYDLIAENPLISRQELADSITCSE